MKSYLYEGTLNKREREEHIEELFHSRNNYHCGRADFKKMIEWINQGIPTDKLLVLLNYELSDCDSHLKEIDEELRVLEDYNTHEVKQERVEAWRLAHPIKNR